MRAKHFLQLAVLAAILVGCGPKPGVDPDSVILKCYEKCLSIENGHYEMTKLIKLMSSDDTIRVHNICDFKKLPGDDIYGSAFHCFISSEDLGGSKFHLLYTGDEMIMYNDVKMIGETYPRPGYDDEIRKIFWKNMAFHPYWPVVAADCYPIPDSAMMASGDVAAKFVKKESVGDRECYLVNVKLDPKYDPTTISMIITAMEYDLWIDAENYLPLRFSITKDVEMNGVGATMYEEYTLSDYEFNFTINDALFTRRSVHPCIELPESGKSESKGLLPAGTQAPDGEVYSFSQNKNINLSSYRGRPVLLDFFFTSCPACIGNVVPLNNLHYKYAARGLQVTGLSSDIDKPEDIASFIEKYDVGYTVCQPPYEIRDKYHISCSPTTYLIDKEGRIVFGHTGMLEGEELKELEKLIEELL